MNLRGKMRVSEGLLEAVRGNLSVVVAAVAGEVQHCCVYQHEVWEQDVNRVQDVSRLRWGRLFNEACILLCYCVLHEHAGSVCVLGWIKGAQCRPGWGRVK